MVVAISSLAVDTSYRLTAIFAWETVSCSTSPKFKINFAWLNRVWASDRSRKRKSERAEDGWSRVVAVSVVRASSRCLHIQTGQKMTPVQSGFHRNHRLSLKSKPAASIVGTAHPLSHGRNINIDNTKGYYCCCRHRYHNQHAHYRYYRYSQDNHVKTEESTRFPEECPKEANKLKSLQRHIEMTLVTKATPGARRQASRVE
ncbi:hypothetical protein RRG08_037634 [Elysia crispata]|uniref:Uncharacterized protein n=1 Tax=Elysia crispata TaxID=231223 RepID=A0AAE0YHM8_9GAST|nr:hypothetical protein RRG08_037634 [Elysia crispata]